MKNYMLKFIVIIFIVSASNTYVFPQHTSTHLQEFLAGSKLPGIVNAKRLSDLRDCYNKLNDRLIWLTNESEVNRATFFDLLQHSAEMGLSEKDYQYSLIDAFRNNSVTLKDLDDSLMTDILITDAALQFYSDIAYGNVKPILSYNGLNYTPDCKNIPLLLADFITKKTLKSFVTELSSDLPEVVAIENKIKAFRAVMSDSTFEEVTIAPTKNNATNQSLFLKLYQLGIINTKASSIADSSLKKYIKEAQKIFDLTPDGMLGNNTISELNVPIALRLQQLRISLNYYRWLSCRLQKESVIVVNIPAAYLKVYRNAKPIFEMRVVVGKKATPTPTLTSSVSEVVLYPYWHVPFSIATKELLPAIKRDVEYINAGNYQILDKKGKIVDPHSVNWNALSASYFPYTIRQSTGCDNALGLLKLNFYNPFDVYLHDTPFKGLFKLEKRFFSHGCVRMEKPMELGRLILKNHSLAIDTLSAKDNLKNEKPIVIPADERMPVIIWYNTVSVNSISGNVVFFGNIYDKSF